VGVIARVRALAVGIAIAWVDQHLDEPAPAVVPPVAKKSKQETAPVS
jgi:hypothetical protein